MNNKTGQTWIIRGYVQDNLLHVKPYKSKLAIRGFIEFFGSDGKRITRMFFAEDKQAEELLKSPLDSLIELTGEHYNTLSPSGKDSKMVVNKVNIL